MSVRFLLSQRRSAWLIALAIPLILIASDHGALKARNASAQTATPPAPLALVYVVTDLGALPNDDSSVATGINSKGDIVGNSYSSTSSTPQGAFLWSGGTMTALNTLSYLNGSSAQGINDSDQVVGILNGNQLVVWQGDSVTDLSALYGASFSFDGCCLTGGRINDLGQIAASEGFTFNDTAFDGIYFIDNNGSVSVTGLGALYSTSTGPFSINNKSQVVGQTAEPDYPVYHPYVGVWQAGAITYLAPGTPTAINDLGQIIGYQTFNGGNNYDAVSWQNGTATDLFTLGGPKAEAEGINSLGQIVGNSDTTGPNTPHAFLYTNGTMYDLNNEILDPTWVLTGASGINDSGQIVGTGTHGGATRGYLLTPASGINPNHGGNAGSVTATIVSSGLQTGATATLSASGQPDIVGQNPTLINAGNTIVLQTTFDLTGAQPGLRSVVVTEPDNSTITLPGGFTVDQGGTAQIWVNVIGRTQIEGGVPNMFSVLYGNRGDVDLTGLATVFVTFPTFFSYSTTSVTPSASTQTADGNTLLSFDLVSVPVGASNAIPLTLTAPSSSDFRHHPFQLQAWTYQTCLSGPCN